MMQLANAQALMVYSHELLRLQCICCEREHFLCCAGDAGSMQCDGCFEATADHLAVNAVLCRRSF